MPRGVPNKVLETAEMTVGQDKPRALTTEGPAKLEGRSVEPVDRPMDKEWLDMVAFSREKVTIVINADTNPNAEDPVGVGNNGDWLWLKREQSHTIERRFVESLARAKVTSYTQREEIGPNGVRLYINVPHTACRYPFRVENDPHPRGRDWLKAVLAEA